MKNINETFNEFLLSMVNKDNVGLIHELRHKWKEYLSTPIPNDDAGEKNSDDLKKFIADQITRRSAKDATDNIYSAVMRLLLKQKNDDKVGEETNWSGNCETHVSYTKNQLDEAIKNAKIQGFRDGRLHHPLAGLKFDNETDYINSLNQQKQ